MPPITTVELLRLKEYMDKSGVPYRITSTTGGGHARRSRHYAGLAMDFGGPVPSIDSSALLAIFNAFVPVGHTLHELIYARAPYNIKRGQRRPLYAQAIHHNHVHVAVNWGWNEKFQGHGNEQLQGGKDVVEPDFNPPLPRFVSWLSCPSGGGWGLGADGGVFAVGGAPYAGSMVEEWERKDFVGRTAAKIVVAGGSNIYKIIATSGEEYIPKWPKP
jgi:hypothetical protein